jgi:hypothetical protein
VGASNTHPIFGTSLPDEKLEGDYYVPVLIHYKKKIISHQGNFWSLYE